MDLGLHGLRVSIGCLSEARGLESYLNPTGR